MTTQTQERLDISEFLSDLRGVGINIDQNKSAPRSGATALALSLNNARNKIFIWPGMADSIEWATCGLHNQAIVTVVENERTLRDRIQLRRHLIDPKTHRKADVIRKAARMSSLALPRPAKKTTMVAKTFFDHQRGWGDHLTKVKVYDSVTLEYLIPASTVHFLMGTDENGQFVSMLPKAATSVEEAHAMLRPKGLSKDAVRIGEWFFDPVTDKDMLERLTGAAVRQCVTSGWSTDSAARPLGPTNSRSNHVATTSVRIKGKQYVCGLVLDTRKAAPHAPVMFDAWHRVVKNLEVEPPQTSPLARQTSSWD